MLKEAAHQPEFGLPSDNNCLQYLPGFLKRWLEDEIVSERQKSARDTPLGHLNRAVPFSKIRVYIGMKWAKMAKKCSRGRSSARIRSFFAI